MMLVTAKCEVLQADVMLRTVANRDLFAQGCTKFRRDSSATEFYMVAPSVCDLLSVTFLAPKSLC